MLLSFAYIPIIVTTTKIEDLKEGDSFSTARLNMLAKKLIINNNLQKF